MSGKLIGLTLLFIPISYLQEEYLSFYDELVVLLFLVLFLFHKRSRSLNKTEKHIIFFLAFFYLVGLFSTIYSPYKINIFSASIDAFTIFKHFFLFILIPQSISYKTKYEALNFLKPIAVLYLISVSLLSIIAQFIDLGLTTEIRYGIHAFHFIFPNHSSFGISVIASLLIITSINLSKPKLNFYFLLALIPLLLTTKGVIYVFLMTVFLLEWAIRRQKIRIFDFILISIGIILISTFQINTYIKDNNSPRMVLLTNSVRVAMENAPLGAGFSKYGGEQAKLNYSELYNKYNLSSTYGLGEEEGQFLNDGYLSMIIGETGFLGLLIYIVLCFLIMRSIIRRDFQNSKLNTFVISAVFMLIVSSLGTGIIKSANGVFLFGVIALIVTDLKDKQYGRFQGKTEIK